MALPHSIETGGKSYTVEEANKALPLVRAIVADIVRQFRTVDEFRVRLSALAGRSRSSSKKGGSAGRDEDPYAEELAWSRSQLESEEGRLREYVEELEKLGIELKGPDGLCDFPSRHEDRPIYLCWRPGESEVRFWHELHTGFAGRQPVESLRGGGSGPSRKTETCSQ
jgi:hypothetical protein